MPTQLPVTLQEGNMVEVCYGRSEYLYHIDEVKDSTLVITDYRTGRGQFEVDEYEIADMLNGGDSAQIIR